MFAAPVAPVGTSGSLMRQSPHEHKTAAVSYGVDQPILSTARRDRAPWLWSGELTDRLGITDRDFREGEGLGELGAPVAKKRRADRDVLVLAVKDTAILI